MIEEPANRVGKAVKLLGRCFLLFAAVVCFQWGWRIWVALGRSEEHFNAKMADSELWRYFASPLCPLLFVGSALLLLAIGSQRRRFRRMTGAISLGVLFLGLFTPDGFAHDMSHIIVRECSEAAGRLHLVRCGSVVALGFLGLALTDFRAKHTAPATSLSAERSPPAS